jgi:hypothetical protein
MGGEVENGSYLFTGESVEHLHDLVNSEAVFQILEYRSDRYARSPENPCATHFSGYAFYCRTL